MSKSLCGEPDCPKPDEFCENCVRADERERIAQAIEAAADHTMPICCAGPAARIARNGGELDDH